MTWQVVTGASLVIGLAYLGISFLVLRGLAATHQLRTNRLGLATGLIFLSCAVHHGSHAVHMLLPAFGIDDAAALAMREAWHWPGAAWDVAGAVVAVLYLSLRSSYAGPAATASMFDDHRAREHQAREINDSIVQGLTRVKWALEADRVEDARAAADDTLADAQRMITDLLDESTSDDLGPGALRRRVPASAQTA